MGPVVSRPRLLVAEGIDRVQARRPPGGHDPEEEPDADREQEGEDDRLRGEERVPPRQARQEEGSAGTQQDAGDSPRTQIVRASIRNCNRMMVRVAPIAIRTPISRVRSVTDTSMMFMIPIPPTSKLTPATDARRNDRVRVVSSAVERRSDRFRIRKSEG